eukprot:2546453-Prymnesium_polylepis.1
MARRGGRAPSKREAERSERQSAVSGRARRDADERQHTERQSATIASTSSSRRGSAKSTPSAVERKTLSELPAASVELWATARRRC